MDELAEQRNENLSRAVEIIQRLSEKYPDDVAKTLPWTEGFLFGTALYPDLVPVSECCDTLVPPASIQLISTAESSELMDAISVFYDSIIQKVVAKDVEGLLGHHGHTSVGFAYLPESDFNQWIYGMSMSMIWLRDAWEDILKQLKDLPDLVSEFRTAQSVLLYFKDKESGDLIVEELSKESEAPKSREELNESFFKMIPWAVSTWVECFDLFQPMESDQAESDPTRNDLCPCGSGKKFKKCCLVQSESH